MRLFVGIDLPEDIKKKLIDFRESLKSVADSRRWRQEDHYHLTLKFLGEVKKEFVVDIDYFLHCTYEQAEGFSVTLNGLDCFGLNAVKKSARVLLLKLTEGLDKLRVLKTLTDKALENFQFVETTQFTPHFTLAYDVMFKKDFENIQKEKCLPEFLAFKVDSVQLFESKLVNQRRIYKVIKKYKLI